MEFKDIYKRDSLSELTDEWLEVECKINKYDLRNKTLLLEDVDIKGVVKYDHIWVKEDDFVSIDKFNELLNKIRTHKLEISFIATPKMYIRCTYGYKEKDWGLSYISKVKLIKLTERKKVKVKNKDMSNYYVTRWGKTFIFKKDKNKC